MTPFDVTATFILLFWVPDRSHATLGPGTGLTREPRPPGGGGGGALGWPQGGEKHWPREGWGGLASGLLSPTPIPTRGGLGVVAIRCIRDPLQGPVQMHF